MISTNDIVHFTDTNWRLNNLYYIIDKRGNCVPFQENEIQHRINKSKSSRKKILKARQFGVSTNEIVKMFDWCCFTQNATGVIMAHEKDSITKLFRIVTRLYKFMPEIIRPAIDRGGGSKHEMYFPEINSRIYCDLESRSDTIGRLHISESAFMKDSSKIKSTLQAVPLDGYVTEETTPNGMGNHFYDSWVDPESSYEKLFFPWYLFSGYQIPTAPIIWTDEELELKRKAKRLFNVELTNEQIAFRRFKKLELKSSSHDRTRVTFEQEYPEDDITCFLSSGEAVMDLARLKTMLDSLGPAITERDGIKIHKEPKKGRRYVCGADPAEGVGKDFSVGVLIDVDDLEVVAVLRGQWKPSDFARKLFEVCKMYSSPGPIYPTLAVERNNHGHAVILMLDETLSYPNLYVHQDEKQGWKTDAVTRPIMINVFIDAVEDSHLRLNDRDILGECLTLVDNNGKIEAAPGKHDDCVAACAIALQVCLQNKTSSYDDIERRIRL